MISGYSLPPSICFESQILLVQADKVNSRGRDKVFTMHLPWSGTAPGECSLEWRVAFMPSCCPPCTPLHHSHKSYGKPWSWLAEGLSKMPQWRGERQGKSQIVVLHWTPLSHVERVPLWHSLPASHCPSNLLHSLYKLTRTSQLETVPTCFQALSHGNECSWQYY